MENVERWRLLAEQFIKSDTSAFIKEVNGDFHFCKIIVSGEDTVLVENFAPPQRAGVKEHLHWLLIKEFDEYKEGRE